MRWALGESLDEYIIKKGRVMRGKKVIHFWAIGFIILGSMVVERLKMFRRKITNRGRKPK